MLHQIPSVNPKYAFDYEVMHLISVVFAQDSRHIHHVKYGRQTRLKYCLSFSTNKCDLLLLLLLFVVGNL
jgi:hypothetical protein